MQHCYDYQMIQTQVSPYTLSQRANNCTKELLFGAKATHWLCPESPLLCCFLKANTIFLWDPGTLLKKHRAIHRCSLPLIDNPANGGLNEENCMY